MRGEARVKIFRHRLRPAHGYRRREEGIGAAHPREWIAHQLGVEMDHLPQRMHAGVGAACHGGRQGHAGKLAQRRLEHVLHGVAVRLRLPSRKRGTVVLDAERDARHAE